PNSAATRKRWRPRVRVESRTLSAPRENQDRTYDIEIARAILRDDADRLVESLRELAAENARVEPDSDNKFKVLIAKQSKPDAEETKIKLEEAGFEGLALREVTASPQKSAIDTTSAAAPKSPVNSQTRLRFTSRPAAPTRELIAFARGTAPSFHSSAPLIFASTDEKN